MSPSPSATRNNFSRAADLWGTPGREAEKPHLGSLPTDLLVYPTTALNLRTRVRTHPVG
ncbi:hypothetical protein [Streptomyces sp. NPDC094149]|uniref:DUF2199 domain-containing protein n=1 Tax=Streptomyces sp. NPDC094149 TaxID=3155079 RepID=UPI0033235577